MQADVLTCQPASVSIVIAAQVCQTDRSHHHPRPAFLSGGMYAMIADASAGWNVVIGSARNHGQMLCTQTRRRSSGRPTGTPGHVQNRRREGHLIDDWGCARASVRAGKPAVSAPACSAEGSDDRNDWNSGGVARQMTGGRALVDRLLRQNTDTGKSTTRPGEPPRTSRRPAVQQHATEGPHRNSPRTPGL